MRQPIHSALIPCVLAVAAACALSGGCSRDGDGTGGRTARGVPEEVVQDNVLGTAYLGQQKWEEAGSAFRQALEKRPADPLLLTNLGVTLIQQGDYDAAEQALRDALATDPDNLRAHYNLGLLQDRHGNFEEAVRHFEAVAEQDADDLHTLYYLGTGYSRLERMDDAERTLRAALARDPTHVSSLYGLGRLLVRRDRQDEGAELIARSQQIRSRSGLDEAVGGQYGEQGPYAMGADYPGDALAAPAPIEVTFAAGGQAEVTRPGVWTVLPLAGRPVLLAPAAGGLAGLAPGESIALWVNPVAPPDAAAWSRALALAAGDVDGDGLADVMALTGADGGLAPTLALQDDGGTLVPAGDSRFDGVASLGGEAVSAALTLVDRDHDGDLDAFWCWTRAGGPAACALATNDGSGRFAVQSAAEAGIQPAHRGAGPVWVGFSDVDNDRDVDLLAAFPSGVEVYGNQRDGSFQRLDAGLPGAADVAVADVDKDGWMDLVLAGSGGLRFALNRRGTFDAPQPLEGVPADLEPAGGLVVLDHDNDGFLDLALGTASGPLLLRNLGLGRFEPRAGAIPGNAAHPLTAYDADGDGDQDLIAADGGDTVHLLDNRGGEANRHMTIASRGVGDNHFGIGAKVEVLAGALRQKFEITSPLPLHAGLGHRETVQSVRYLWPSGVLQDEVRLAAGDVEVEQLDRKGTSCPLLYAWRDGGWRFVTDFLGGSAIGYQQRPGVFSVPDTDEYVAIEGGLQPDEEGWLKLRLNNQLEEVIWFDAAELVVVDHPLGTEVFPNERLMPGPPWPAFELFASDDVRPVRAARGVESGLDHGPRLAERDGRWVDDFELLPFKGYARRHTLELDLGALPADRRVVLLLDGWIDYADSSANVAAAQAGAALEPPRLLVADGRGGWVERPGVMGFPAGLPKTMAVELTGLFPTSDLRLRLATTMRIYWDRARVLLGGEATPLEVRRLRPARAVLRDGGFPAPLADGGTPLAYDPHRVSRVTPWKAHAGEYSAFGEVTGLLGAVDDRLVTTRNGDEIELRFPSPPPPAPGRVRSYLLFADGFGKDMDPNSAASDTVGPVPFHGMPAYPYGASIAPPVASAPGGPGTGLDGERPRRHVAPSPRGWPGAWPQALAGGARPDAPATALAELVIAGGEVLDGSGAPPVRADVAIDRGRVVAVGRPGTLAGERTIDATGRVVAPGFVDMHSHADLILLGGAGVQQELLRAKLMQGVTTIVVGNCGLGPAPAGDEAAALLAGINGWMTPDGVEAGPLSVAGYLARLEAGGVLPNVATLVPHGAVRVGAMGLAPGPPAAAALAAMRRAVTEGLDAGAFGLSAGLIYPPGIYSPTAELTALAQVVAERDGLVTLHVRGSSETLLAATRELLSIARDSGARVHHSHLEAVGERFWPDVERVLALEDAARQEGLRVSHDVFPYTRAATMMAAIFPPWSLEGGVPALLDRLRDPATRRRIAADVGGHVPQWPPWVEGGWPHNLAGAVGWDGILIASVAPGGPSELVGHSLEALASRDPAGRQPFDLVADLMLSQGGRVGQLVDQISGRDQHIDPLLRILQHPAAAIVSDAEDYGRGVPHPAHAGAFARALRLARERELMPLGEVVHRMTGRPATLLGLADRGRIRTGAAADLVILDPARVADRASWDAPRRAPEGIDAVLVNGVTVVESGRWLGGTPGRVLRRSPRRDDAPPSSRP